jgi:hypothetical protein
MRVDRGNPLQPEQHQHRGRHGVLGQGGGLWAPSCVVPGSNPFLNQQGAGVFRSSSCADSFVLRPLRGLPVCVLQGVAIAPPGGKLKSRKTSRRRRAPSSNLAAGRLASGQSRGGGTGPLLGGTWEQEESAVRSLRGAKAVRCRQGPQLWRSESSVCATFARNSRLKPLESDLFLRT